MRGSMTALPEPSSQEFPPLIFHWEHVSLEQEGWLRHQRECRERPKLADGVVSPGEFFRDSLGGGATSMGFHKIREIHGYRKDTDYNSRGTPGSPL